MSSWSNGPFLYESLHYPNIREVNLQRSNESIADTKRNVKVEETTNSKIPSIFDHIVRNSSAIESYYHVTDSTYSHGGIALVANPYSTGGHLTEVAYSNVKVWKL